LLGLFHFILLGLRGLGYVVLFVLGCFDFVGFLSTGVLGFCCFASALLLFCFVLLVVGGFGQLLLLVVGCFLRLILLLLGFSLCV